MGPASTPPPPPCLQAMWSSQPGASSCILGGVEVVVVLPHTVRQELQNHFLGGCGQLGFHETVCVCCHAWP